MRDTGALLAGRYRLHERVGAGGMGEVWRAFDEKLERQIAVKLIHRLLVEDPGFLQRFRAEARALAKVQHPNVVGVHDFDDSPTSAFLVMQYVDGEPLSAVLQRHRRLTPQATMELIAQAADALQAAHERGIVHRDVKPANLLVRQDGAAILTDFGVARMMEGTQRTATGAMLGTLSYLAPEQVLGKPATAQTDIYALGIVTYECLAGHRPFDRDNPAATMMARVQESPPTLAATIPLAVCAVLEKALATDPADRWRSARDMGSACRDAVRRVTSVGTAPVAPPVRPAAAMPRRDSPSSGITLIAITLPGRETAGYTLRGYGRVSTAHDHVADQEEVPVFLSHNGRLLLFATEEALVSFIGSGAPHDLTQLDAWDAAASSQHAAGFTRAEYDSYDLDLLPTLVMDLRRSRDLGERLLLVSAADLARDLGQALRLESVLTALASGSLLDALDIALLAPYGADRAGVRALRRELNRIGTDRASVAWFAVVNEICAAVDWRE